MRKPSIIQSEKKSFLSGATSNLTPHEPIGGKNKRISEKEGLWVWLTFDEHRWIHDTDEGELKDKELSAMMEHEWYKHTGKSKQDWYRLFYKHYILD